MDDTTKLFVGAIVLALGLIVMVLFVPRPLPIKVIVPTEQVNAGVMRFENRIGWGDWGEQLRVRVEGELVNRPGVQVYTRSALDRVLQEQRLCAGGFCDPGSAVKLGNLTGLNKLVTGVLLNLETSIDATEICKDYQLWPPKCLRSVPGKKLRIEIEVQVQVINTSTGQIELSDKFSRSASDESEDGTPDANPVIIDALDSIAYSVASKVQSGFTRSIEYGLFKDFQSKGAGFEGIGRTDVFELMDSHAILLIHVSRMLSKDQLQIIVLNPSGNVVYDKTRLMVKESEWFFFLLPLYSDLLGVWQIETLLNGQKIFTHPFTLTREIGMGDHPE